MAFNLEYLTRLLHRSHLTLRNRKNADGSWGVSSPSIGSHRFAMGEPYVEDFGILTHFEIRDGFTGGMALFDE